MSPLLAEQAMRDPAQNADKHWAQEDKFKDANYRVFS